MFNPCVGAQSILDLGVFPWSSINFQRWKFFLRDIALKLEIKNYLSHLIAFPGGFWSFP